VIIIKSISVLTFICASIAQADDWRLTAKIGDDGTRGPRIDFELVYVGKGARALYASDLPWGIRTSLTTVLVNVKDPATVFEPVPFVDDPTPDKIKFVNGKKMRGSVLLQNRYRPSDLQRGLTPLGVCWSYEMRKLSPSSQAIAHGCATLMQAR
jgi:hypothetical protein